MGQYSPQKQPSLHRRVRQLSGLVCYSCVYDLRACYFDLVSLACSYLYYINALYIVAVIFTVISNSIFIQKFYFKNNDLNHIVEQFKNIFQKFDSIIQNRQKFE